MDDLIQRAHDAVVDARLGADTAADTYKSRIFDQKTWETNILSAGSAACRWFCFRRRAKLKLLLKYLREGSAAYEHGIILDRVRMSRILENSYQSVMYAMKRCGINNDRSL
jgi:hypothetical protein